MGHRECEESFTRVINRQRKTEEEEVQGKFTPNEEYPLEFPCI